ncbi:Sodium/potassium/calcium exchanger 5 [Hondaea fermentalgiana]|uniref:Sodium/potassium/calcium exchanger 5 n=1 Tax=Hondaea fermentalgiana TaxID=2315210 RepID=A0A2R5G3N7_9STRA|nr:Sodium/potassium/calcium exchanger 5 [Hondaea fermentalgiana]|eukprot:GBG24939.1 Sodium/potassium/calcium exchanger 5 [Hondaea fermentalgiana]
MVLGWLFTGALVGATTLAVRSTSDWGALSQGFEAADTETSARRQLSDLFMTEQEQCAGYSDSLAPWLFVSVIYSFVGLAVITDEYFEPTLALLSDDLKLSPDVAGATFMAIGSSAPELLTSFVDVFLSKASVGIGTILGSAMFNLLVIVAGTAIIGKSKAGGALHISAWPLGRDSFFYVMSILALGGIMLNDGELCVFRENRFEIFANSSDTSVTEDELLCFVGLVQPVEGALLVLFYICYIVFMMYNEPIHKAFERAVFYCTSRFCKPIESHVAGQELSGLEATLDRQQAIQAERNFNRGIVPATHDDDVPRERGHSDIDEFANGEEDDFPGKPWEFPDSIGGKLYHIIAFPYYFVFWLTIPVTRLPEGKCRNATLFLFCLAYITGLTIAMVYAATFASCLIHLDPFIIGYVLLAIGTSVPDALASFIVARDGHGDMAVSNAIGSNVFDILLGLGLPWFLAGLVFNEQVIRGDERFGGSFVVNNGVIFGLVLLLVALAIFITSLMLFKWKLRIFIAYILLAYYACFLLVIILANTCKLPICIELDCSRCGYEPSLFLS